MARTRIDCIVQFQRLCPRCYSTVKGWPLSVELIFSRNGAAVFAHSVATDNCLHRRQTALELSVLMVPGFSATAARPAGSSCASDCVRLQSPTSSRNTSDFRVGERPQPELKFTMTPLPA